MKSCGIVGSKLLTFMVTTVMTDLLRLEKPNGKISKTTASTGPLMSKMGSICTTAELESDEAILNVGVDLGADAGVLAVVITF